MLNRVFRTMSVYPKDWWIADGWAIDLHLRRQFRTHKDVEIAVLRRDQQELQSAFSDWTLQKSVNGALEAWSSASGSSCRCTRCMPGTVTSTWSFSLVRRSMQMPSSGSPLPRMSVIRNTHGQGRFSRRRIATESFAADVRRRTLRAGRVAPEIFLEECKYERLNSGTASRRQRR